MEESRSGTTSGTELGIIVVGLMMLVLLAGFFYQRYRVPINDAWLELIRVQVAAFAWLDFSEAQKLYNWAGKIQPEQLQWEHMVRAGRYAGEWMRWINLCVLLPLAIVVFCFTDKARLFRKRYSARDLLKRNIDLFPCIAPALTGRNLLNEPLHEGPWAVAKSPTRFVADHGLLVGRDGQPVPRDWLITPEGLPNEDSPLQDRGPDGTHPGANYRFDREKAIAILQTQLGDRFSGIAHLSRHRKALAAAFLTFAHGERERAQAFLDQLSLSFREPGKTALVLDTTGMDELLVKYPITPAIERRLDRHRAYVTTWMVALLTCAREKGLLPPAEFLWLRPADRTLWYALNQTGGRIPWTEASGIWAHYEAEEMMRMSLYTPEVDAAADALESSLVNNGWLPEPVKQGNAL